jgi:hypothetical protein
MKSNIPLGALIFFSLFPPFQDSFAGIEDPGAWSAPAPISLQSGNGKVQAVIRKLQFTWRRDTDNGLEEYDVATVFVPLKSLYWLGEAGDNARFHNKYLNRVFFLFRENIVGVVANDADSLRFYVSSSHAKTSDPYQEIDNLLTQRRTQLGRQKWDIEPIRFNLESVLGACPFTGVLLPEGEPASTITKIEVNADNFTIEFAGGKDNTIKATITFNSSFHPISATLRDKEVFPSKG